MADSIIFSESYGRVLVDPTVPCVITQWLGFANRAEFVTMQQAGLEYFEAHSTREHPWGWVGDVRQMGAIPAEAQAWLAREFNPRAVAAGLREVSVVESANVISTLATKQYAHNTGQTYLGAMLSTAFYASMDEAKAGARQALATG